jgi:hypothetical protein
MAREDLTEQVLLAILNQQLLAHDNCSSCRFDGIGRLRNIDDNGCNWYNANLRCSGRPAEICLPVAREVISTAQEKYNLK